MANDTEYGLVAYLYTRDLGRSIRVMEQLEYGMIGLNQGMVSNPAAPFGGIKHSGVGREGGYEGIQEYLETKYCAVTYLSGSCPSRRDTGGAVTRSCHAVPLARVLARSCSSCDPERGFNLLHLGHQAVAGDPYGRSRPGPIAQRLKH